MVVAALALVVPGGLLAGQVFTGSGASAQEPSSARTDSQQAHQELVEYRCRGLGRRLGSSVQAYVGQFTDASATSRKGPSLPSVPNLRSQAAEVRAEVARLGCDPDAFLKRTRQTLHAIDPEGMLASTVAHVVSANVLDVLANRSGGPTDGPRVVMSLGDDLAAAVADLPAGATLVLPPGRFQVDQPLVLLQDTRIVGSGAGRTRIHSTARGAAILVAGRADLQLVHLGLRHVGDAPGSVLVLRGGNAELDAVHLSGGRAATRPQPQGGSGADRINPLRGGSGVVLAGAEELTVRRGRITGNDVAGVVAAGSAQVSLRHATLSGNGTCGICWLGMTHGSLRQSRLRGNGVGLVIGGKAHPEVVGNEIAANDRAGAVVQAHAHPTVRGNRMRDNDKVAVVFTGHSRGTVSANSCSGADFGVVLDGNADPDAQGAGCPVHDQRRTSAHQ